MNIMTFTDGLDLVAALLISFGALIGKIGPYQLVLMTILGAMFYAFNKAIWLVGTLDFADGKHIIRSFPMNTVLIPSIC